MAQLKKIKWTPRTKICLVASGGGHLRQLLMLAPALNRFQTYIVTEDTPLGASLSDQHKVYFVPHFAAGQRQLEGYFRMALSAVRNFMASLWHLLKERPDVIVSTGAGAAFFTVFLGWIFRRKVVYIESIARVKATSLFGRLSRRFADLFIVQWPDLAHVVPGARYCDPIKVVASPPTAKKDQVLVTIGTFVPFDRLVSGVANAMSANSRDWPIVAQVGDSEKTFDGISSFKTCSYDKLNELMEESRLVICHGGSGSMLSALNAGCHVVAMARRVEFGEVYDDHQLELIGALSDRGLIEAAADENDLERAIRAVLEQKPKTVEIDPEAQASQIESLFDFPKEAVDDPRD